MAVFVTASNPGVNEVTVVVGAWKENLQAVAFIQTDSKDAAKKRITSAVCTFVTARPVALMRQVS